MQTFQSPAITDLARQLRRGPTRLRLRQLLNVDFLLSIIEAEKAYPADFVCHALTGYRVSPMRDQEWNGRLIDGEALISDLITLAERLSEDANIDIEQWNGVVYSISELAERFDVSTKTIFRWRRRGLAGWKFRFPDRRKRVAFPERCIRRFVARHTDLVHRGSSFSQLTKAERRLIIERAQACFDKERASINAVAKIIAAETNRAVETIRLILKAYDESHPGAGIFNRSQLDVEGGDQRLAIWEAYVDGATVETLARRFDQPLAWIYETVTQMRARELKTRKIEFIPNTDFESDTPDQDIINHPDALQPFKVEKNGSPRVPAGLPPYLQQLFRLPLLTREGELALFRKMNYLKYAADRRRQSIDPDTVKAAELDRIERLLERAQNVKNQITQANLRLVVSIAKRHMAPTLDFFEIISDGNVSLMRAVERFDYGRGFKFSTYSSWAIIRNYARLIPERRYHHDRYQTGRDELLENVIEPYFDEQDDEYILAIRGALERMLETLDQREGNILRQRFGLDEYGQSQTLEQIGRRFGVSKERIRQLESRAIGKLRTGFGAEVEKLLGV